MLLYVFYFVQPQHTKSKFVQPQHTKSRLTYSSHRDSWLIIEDILHNIYTEKGAITGMRLNLFTVEVGKEFSYMLPSGNKLADAKKEVASYMGRY